MNRQFPALQTTLAAILLLLNGCSRKVGINATANSSWTIESWDKGVITARHQGYIYTATCDSSDSFHNSASITDGHYLHTFQTCDLALGLIGQSIQPFGGKHRDADGWVVQMWNVGKILAIHRWKDDQTPWWHEQFIITSVAKLE